MYVSSAWLDSSYLRWEGKVSEDKIYHEKRRQEKVVCMFERGERDKAMLAIFPVNHLIKAFPFFFYPWTTF